jgi:mono/diheme cytochrome c family protein
VEDIARKLIVLGQIIVLALGFLIWGPVPFSLDHAFGEERDESGLGKKTYEERCLICHGSQGDGLGPAGVLRRTELSGRLIEVYSRDFQVGTFKFRTTPTGCLPTDKDLMRIITQGIPRSFMPAHKDVAPEAREAVMEYIKSFSERWEEEDPCDPIKVNKPATVGSPASVIRGKKVYKEMQCGQCHGETGIGDGPKANELKDDWGKKILPFNFTTGDLKRGSSPENIYITFTTGLDGSGMPSYEEYPKEKERWDLVSYTLEMMKRKWDSIKRLNDGGSQP